MAIRNPQSVRVGNGEGLGLGLGSEAHDRALDGAVDVEQTVAGLGGEVV